MDRGGALVKGKCRTGSLDEVLEQQYIAGSKVFEKIAYRSGTEAHVGLFKQRH